MGISFEEEVMYLWMSLDDGLSPRAVRLFRVGPEKVLLLLQVSAFGDGGFSYFLNNGRGSDRGRHVVEVKLARELCATRPSWSSYDATER